MTPHDNEQDNIGLRRMTRDDIPLGMRLATTAGWNQTEDDWQMLLATGFGFVAICEGAPVGTATVMPYGGAFSWIGMVLVDPVYRRRGVGTALLGRAIAEAGSYGCVRLDATPQGAPLYTRLGFRAEYGLVRMVRQPQEMPLPVAATLPGIPDNVVCRPLDPARLPDLSAYDTPIFGAVRGGVLEALFRNVPRYALVGYTGRAVCGYCLGRSGAVYEQVGPVVADSVEIAQALLVQALRACGERTVIVDVLSAKGAWVAYLEDLGFVAQRPFTRMVLGRACPSGEPERQYAIAGPEIG